MCRDELIFFFQAEDGMRDLTVTGVQTCALPILLALRAGDRCGLEGEQLLQREHAHLVHEREQPLLRRLDADDERQHERSEEHTSELQSQSNLVCRLLLEKKKRDAYNVSHHT